MAALKDRNKTEKSETLPLRTTGKLEPRKPGQWKEPQATEPSCILLAPH